MWQKFQYVSKQTQLLIAFRIRKVFYFLFRYIFLDFTIPIYQYNYFTRFNSCLQSAFYNQVVFSQLDILKPGSSNCDSELNILIIT